MVVNFTSYEKVLIKWFYTSKDFSYFKNFSKFVRTSRENVAKILKNASKVKLKA